MGLARTYRVFEGSLVALFFLQAVRVVFAVLLHLTGTALATGETSVLLVNGHLLLLAALVPVWLSPRKRTALPETLSISAMLVAIARVVMSVQDPSIRLYAGLALIAVALVYFASLLRANWRVWSSIFVVGLTLDQLFRASNTYDLSLRVWFDVPTAGNLYRVPWIAVQAGLSLLLIIISRLSRRSARHEPYHPASLSLWSSLSFGAFIALETLVLGMPNVIARWANVSYAGLVPWVVAATALPLLPTVRSMMEEVVDMFDDRLRGWVWLVALLLLVVVGNRFLGFGAAAALIVAQFMVVLTLWWVPIPPDPADVEQVGPNISVGAFIFILFTYAFSLTFEYAHGLPWMRNQGLLIILIATGVLSVSRVIWRDDDLWDLRPTMPRGVAISFVAPVTIFSLILSGINADITAVPLPNTVRVATYNINGGYDAQGTFRLDLISRTIEAGLADIVVLQEVDTGRPVSYNVDEVEYLARRLNMYQVFLPAVEQVRGIAILSRWPLTDPATILYDEYGEQLGAVRATVSDPVFGRQLTVIGTQFQPGVDTERMEQLALTLTLLGDASPAVLAADFGAPPGGPVYEQLVGATSFVDPEVVLGIEGGYTTPAANPVIRQDIVLLRGMVPLDSRQVDSTASDHRLVVVEAGWESE